MEKINENVEFEKKGTVGFITISNPPVNALGFVVREGIVKSIQMAKLDDTIKSVVILCKGKMFSAGADIREFGKPLQMKKPILRDVIQTIEESTIPIVAAMHGSVYGGGLEMALSCHFRIVAPNTKLCLPEVKLGLIPGSGGTQRLTRLAGIETSLSMITTGNPIESEKALECGLVDSIIDDDLAENALKFAESIFSQKKAIRLVRDVSDKTSGDFSDLFNKYRKDISKKHRGFLAPQYCVDAIEAATRLNITEGLKFERKLFLDLMNGNQSKALRYYFFAERQVTKHPLITSETTLIPIQKIALVGAGKMVTNLADRFVNLGKQVILYNDEKGSIKQNVKETDLIKITKSPGDLADADLVIEALDDRYSRKKEFFKDLDTLVKPEAIFATTSSQPMVDDLAAATNRSMNIVGLHLPFSVKEMSLLEIVRGISTSGSVLSTMLALVKDLNKVGIIVKNSEGFAADRMLTRLYNEWTKIVREGASISQVDDVLYIFGFPRGLFSERYRAQKNEDSGKPLVDKSAVSDEEILQRCIYSIVNEGAKIIEEGIVSRASDLDAIWVKGFGWPKHMGGPMFYADITGLNNILNSIKMFEKQFGNEWSPAPLLIQHVSEGSNFGDFAA